MNKPLLTLIKESKLRKKEIARAVGIADYHLSVLLKYEDKYDSIRDYIRGEVECE